MEFSTQALINIIFTVAIFIYSYFKFHRLKKKFFLYLGVAFGLFSISHIYNYLGKGAEYSLFLALTRIAAYILVIYALAKEK